MIERWKIERDHRQLDIVLSQLDRFESGCLPLPSLIASLKSLLSLLEVVGEDWKDDFRAEWGTLEVSYAKALDEKEQGVILDIDTYIGEISKSGKTSTAIHNIRKLTQTALDHLGSRLPVI